MAESAIELRHRERLTQLDVRGDVETLQALAMTLGAPGFRVGEVVHGDGVALLGLAPDEMLLVTGSGRAQALEAVVRAVTAGAICSVVDVSANRHALELAGPDAAGVLATVCELDLRPASFPAGRCAQIPVAGADAIVERLSEGEAAFRLYVRPSFAGHVRAWLEDAHAEGPR